MESIIKCLNEAEEESSGAENDEDENIEVVYSKAARAPKAECVPKAETVSSANKDDDIDNDAI